MVATKELMMSASWIHRATTGSKFIHETNPVPRCPKVSNFVHQNQVVVTRKNFGREDQQCKHVLEIRHGKLPLKSHRRGW
jgi:hypothetical protein